MELTRKQKILKLIVEDFIKYAEPVGSNYLISKYNLDISSATVRNIMSELEEDGLLEKTHTSSGRIPSTMGYRYYIENLRNQKINSKFKIKYLEYLHLRSQLKKLFMKAVKYFLP